MAGYAPKIREYLKALSAGETASPREIAFDLRLDRRLVQATLKDMIKRREIDRISRGRYQHCRPDYQPRLTRIKRKILRAIHLKGAFNLREIVILTDANRNYINQIVRGLIESDDLEVLPRQLDEVVGQRVPRYRVRRPDEFYKKYVLNGRSLM